jgi:fucose permease
MLIALGLEMVASTQSFLLVQVAIFVIGCGGGVLNGATNALVADISAGGRGASLSLLGVFFGIGALGMPAVLGVLSKTYEQDTIIAGIGAVVFAVAIFFLAIRYPVPKQPQGFRWPRVSLIKDATLILFGMILFFESGMEGMVSNWTTTFLQHKMNIAQEHALFALSCLVAELTLRDLSSAGC